MSNRGNRYAIYLFDKCHWLTGRKRHPTNVLEINCEASVKYFYRPFQCNISFVDHLCYLCLVFVMHWRVSVN